MRGLRSSVLTTRLALLALIGCCFAGVIWPNALPLLANLVPVAGLVVCRALLRFGPLSPVSIVVVVFSFIGFAGYLFADDLDSLGGGGMRISLDSFERRQTAYVFALTSGLTLLGTCSVLILNRRAPAVRLRSFSMSNRAAPLYLLGALLPLVLVLASIQDEFFERDRYLAGVGGSNAFGLGQQLGIASVAIAGNVYGSRKGVLKIVAVLVAVSFVILFLGLGSRRLALTPVAFALGYAIARPGKFFYAIVPAALISALLLPLPLHLRGLSVHGLIPYSYALDSYNFFATNWVETINNVLIAFPITGATAFGVSPIPLSNLGISLNPLPGAFVGWYEISSSMTHNRWTPFSAVGEAANYGIPWMVLVWVGLGAALGIIEVGMAKVVRAGYSVAAICAVGLVSLFALQAIQYTMRASTRMLVYALGVLILFTLLAKWRGLYGADTSSTRLAYRAIPVSSE